MEKERSHMTERILNLTLEIIYLLTGEIYGPLKKSGGHVTPKIRSHILGGLNRNLSPIMEPTPPILTPETDKEKILKATQKMTELLTGEVPIRCQDVTVYLSMEEWEYLKGHKELYKEAMMEELYKNAMMASLPALTSSDGPGSRIPPERCSHPLHSKDSMKEGHEILQEDQDGDPTIIKVDHSDEWEDEEETPPEINIDGRYKMRKVDIYHINPPIHGFDENGTKDSQTENPITPNHAEFHQGHSLSDPRIHRSTFLDGPHPIVHHAGLRWDERFPPSGFPKFLTTNSDLQPHLVTQGGEGLLSFLDCGRTFTKPSRFLIHKQIHTGENPYTCVDCGKVFTKKSHLLTHQRIHTGEKPYSCSLCGKSFKDKSNLVKHEVTHTGNYPFSCPVGRRGYVQKSLLDLHQREHTTDKPYTCMVCGKSFAKNSHFVMHHRTHAVEKPYCCSECGKSFIKRSHLISHELIHRKEKPFSCSVCGKGFAQKSNLVTHERIHTGDHPYSCSMCGRCFTHRSNLVRHKRVHTGGFAYSCPQCGKWFAQKSQLVAHENNHEEENFELRH